MIETRFKDAELCMIPEDWTSGTFQDFLATFSSGATPYRGIPDNFKGDVRWISSGELNYNTIVETIEHISKEAVVRTNLKMHQPGTFLMAITGLEAAGTRGRCAIIGKPSTTNQSCLAINSTDKMGTDYLYWFYNFWSETLAFKFAQGTKQQSFTAEIVRKLPIYCPKDKSEQTRIATALSNIDALISELSKLIEKKRAIKQGAMQQLLTGKKRLKGFSEPWVEKKLGEIAETSSGGTPSRNNGSFYNGTVKWFTTTELKDCLLFDSYEHITENAIKFSSAKVFPKGTLLMAMYGATIGRLGILQDDAATNQACCAILASKSIDTKFLFYYLYKQRDSIVSLGCGAGQPNISQQIVQCLNVFLPSALSEQSAIASVLTSMDNEIYALEAKKAKYEQIKQGMMQQLLTGKIRLID